MTRFLIVGATSLLGLGILAGNAFAQGGVPRPRSGTRVSSPVEIDQGDGPEPARQPAGHPTRQCPVTRHGHQGRAAVFCQPPEATEWVPGGTAHSHAG